MELSQVLFRSSGGLRHWDLHSSSLFMMVMKAFSQLIEKEVRGGYLNACLMRGRGSNDVKISHLLLADENLIAYETT